jgi:glutathione S-transferase
LFHSSLARLKISASTGSVLWGIPAHFSLKGICRHSDSFAPVAVAASDPAYGDYLNFLHFGEATLTFPQALVLRYGHFEPPERRQPQVVEDYTRWFLSRLRTLEPRLARGLSACPGR